VTGGGGVFPFKTIGGIGGETPTRQGLLYDEQQAIAIDTINDDRQQQPQVLPLVPVRPPNHHHLDLQQLKLPKRANTSSGTRPPQINSTTPQTSSNGSKFVIRGFSAINKKEERPEVNEDDPGDLNELVELVSTLQPHQQQQQNPLPPLNS
jgi:hypothetical protein